MTVREYAESIKQAFGTVLGVYEIFKDYTGTDKQTQLTNFINALPDSALAGLGGMFPSTGDIATFVLSSGPILETVTPAATTSTTTTP